MVLIQYLGQPWQLPNLQGRRFNQKGGIPNGNKEETREEGSQEEKEVSTAAGHGPRLFFCPKVGLRDCCSRGLFRDCEVPLAAWSANRATVMSRAPAPQLFLVVVRA